MLNKPPVPYDLVGAFSVLTVVMRYVQGITYITYYLHGCHEAGGRHHGKIQVLRKHLGSEELGHGLTNEYPSILVLISHWCATSGQALRCLYKMG